MTTPSYDHAFWEQLWAKTLREHPDKVAHRPPNAHLLAEVAALAPGRALDAVSGHGTDALWLAARGWQVDALDFAAPALAHARATADTLGPEIAARAAWIKGDLPTWAPVAARYDLVVCLHVHIAGAVDDMVRRMAAGVAPGGTLLMIGHHPTAGQVQVSVAAATAALAGLGPRAWQIEVAQDRPRVPAGTGMDAVIRARRIA